MAYYCRFCKEYQVYQLIFRNQLYVNKINKGIYYIKSSYVISKECFLREIEFINFKFVYCYNCYSMSNNNLHSKMCNNCFSNNLFEIQINQNKINIIYINNPLNPPYYIKYVLENSKLCNPNNSYYQVYWCGTCKKIEDNLIICDDHDELGYTPRGRKYREEEELIKLREEIELYENEKVENNDNNENTENYEEK